MQALAVAETMPRINGRKAGTTYCIWVPLNSCQARQAGEHSHVVGLIEPQQRSGVVRQAVRVIDAAAVPIYHWHKLHASILLRHNTVGLIDTGSLACMALPQGQGCARACCITSDLAVVCCCWVRVTVPPVVPPRKRQDSQLWGHPGVTVAPPRSPFGVDARLRGCKLL